MTAAAGGFGISCPHRANDPMRLYTAVPPPGWTSSPSEASLGSIAKQISWASRQAKPRLQWKKERCLAQERQLGEASRRKPDTGQCGGVPSCRQDAGSITFERPSTSLSDPDATTRLASLQIRTLCRCKSGAKEAHDHIAGQAVNEHGRVGNTKRNVGKQLKCPAQLSAEMTFSRRRRLLAGTEREFEVVASSAIVRGMGRSQPPTV